MERDCRGTTRNLGRLLFCNLPLNLHSIDSLRGSRQEAERSLDEPRASARVERRGGRLPGTRQRGPLAEGCMRAAGGDALLSRRDSGVAVCAADGSRWGCCWRQRGLLIAELY